MILRSLRSADIGHRYKQLPGTRQDRPRKIRGRRVRFSDGEMVLVSPAVSTKAVWVGNTEIKRRFVFFPGVSEIDTDTVHSGRHLERYFQPCLVLLARDFPVNNNLWWR